MASRPQRRCRRCAQLRDPEHYISTRGLCTACAAAAVSNAIESMYYRRGVVYERWRRGLLAAMRATPHG